MDKFILPINSISNLNEGKKNNQENEKKEKEIKNNNFDSYLDASLKKIEEEKRQIRQKQRDGDRQFLENIRQQIIRENEIVRTK